MAKKDGTNGAKIGRHSRNPSSKMQATRSARNKTKAIAKAQARGDKRAGVPLSADDYKPRTYLASKRLQDNQAPKVVYP